MPVISEAATGRVGILMAVHSSQRGGAEIMALEEAEALVEIFEVVAAVPAGPLEPRFREICHVVHGPAAIPLNPCGPLATARWTVRSFLDFVRWVAFLRRRRCDLVITNSIVVVAPVAAARLLRCPVIVHARDVTETRAARALARLHKHLASTIIAISSHVERDLGPPGRARIVSVRYGVSAQKYSQPTPVTPHSGVVLAVIGTIEPRKGQDIALEALSTLTSRGHRMKLLLIGREQDAAFCAQLRSRAREAGISELVSFTGSVDDVDAQLANVDVVLGPSRAEPLGLALMEAMALGRPVVASRVGGIPEFITDAVTGLLVEPGSASALADAIDGLMRDQDAARALADAGREAVMREFTVERTMARYRHEIDMLVNGTTDGTR